MAGSDSIVPDDEYAYAKDRRVPLCIVDLFRGDRDP